ncbi:elongation factor 4 [Candidatus Beckwithbacteria bacterium CG1_02_47_37]|uniref:Elongation factor 4 n=2 Tax=Candidatus Beckwithiibacteriota TaxID=1752726 RepID=A0A1J4RUM4_9BACT|nr:MAG: elongation factor 4 [Candidatus Beckwithbacteria bacterium CG1_02_47_37]PJC66207.1 MAG: elongation factor 4 [Candidatus Beckwithbacteria bacterium CG_4_9_14_0_2_um_filter_47_11]
MNPSRLRNFCVVSHIDHGKTTLTDRFLELTGTVKNPKRYLDSNPIEQERGITIKLAPVRLHYSLNTIPYILNLIDTPGHVDFAYEVSRSLAACEGAILLVDATAGIQAQTLANAYKAIEQNLTLVPVINKIDLPNAEIEPTKQALIDSFGFKREELLTISAKTGANLIQLIKAVIDRIPPPGGSAVQPLQTLVFNSFYHPHWGVIASVRVVNGSVAAGDRLQFLGSKAEFMAENLGYFSPQMVPAKNLNWGEVGYIATGLKDISLCRVGDTLTLAGSQTTGLPGYLEPKPMMFMDLFPVNNIDFLRLKAALEKLALNDSSLHFVPVTSAVLGSGFKIGFQGLLHADVVQERLELEFDLELISTSPSVEYRVDLRSGKTINLTGAADLPDPTLINQIREPVIELTIFTPQAYLGGVMQLTQARRGSLLSQQYFGSQVQLVYCLPLRELVSDFFSQLKSLSSGFASLDWRFLDYRPVDLVKLEVKLNRRTIGPLAQLVVRSRIDEVAKRLAAKLKAVIPRQQFELPIQVAMGGKILARETIKSWRKDVTVKLHAADPGRKNKLLSKQKKGKKRMKQIGRVNLPQEAFLALMS